MSVKKAVIAAAGLGTRFLPITKAVPKPMLPVLDKPTIQYIVEEAVAAGIEEVIIVVSDTSEVISQHFSRIAKLEERLKEEGKTELLKIAVGTANLAKISFVRQEVPNGLVGALLCAEEKLKGEPFALFLGDELIYDPTGKKPCIGQLIKVFNDTGKSVVATMKVGEKDVSKYGNLGVKTEGRVMEVTAVKEKPKSEEKLSDFAIIGRYVFDGKIFDLFREVSFENGEVYLTDAFNSLAAKDKLLACEFEGKRYDVGDKFGYVAANLEYALRDESLREKTEELIKNVKA